MPDEGLSTGTEILSELGFCYLLPFYVPILMLSSDYIIEGDIVDRNIYILFEKRVYRFILLFLSSLGHGTLPMFPGIFKMEKQCF